MPPSAGPRSCRVRLLTASRRTPAFSQTPWPARGAVGALEATQAGNELTALGVKQALALQGLLAAQHRAETLAKARELAAEDEAKQRFKTFIGNGKAYTASR